MTDTTALVLNQGQREISETFFQFLLGEDPEMIICGPGGVGKTRLMGYLIDTIMPRYQETCGLMGITPEYDDVQMTATTNKAAEALSEATGRPTSTVHSFLNLKVQDNYETGESKLSKTGGWIVHQRKILFVDECSMIDQPLMEAIREGTHGCKTVYVGDHCQLSPVKEPISPIYRQGIARYELTQPMRNHNQPALMSLCQQIRTTVETGDFLPIQIVPGVIDWLDDAAMQRELSSQFNNQTADKRILAYTNKRVIEFNDFVRSERQLGDEFTTGELLVLSTPFHAKTRMLSVEEEVEIAMQSHSTEKIEIAAGVELEVRRAGIKTKLGETFSHVPLPVDRAHYEALTKYYQQQKNWNRYFYLKNTFPDLRQRDAATVHKAQGSTYDTVFIDLGNISSCHNPSQVARMLYVAVSRPRNRIVFYGQLAEKYGGLI